MSPPKKRGFEIEDGGYAALLVLVTLAFAYLVAPFFGAILWGVVAAIMFEPMTRKLAARMGGRKNTAAALVLLLLLALVILPTIVLGVSLVNEATALYNKVKAGDINVSAMLNQLQHVLPESVNRYVRQYSLTDFNTLRRMFGSSVTSGLQVVASQALTLGQGALSFLAALGVMLYLTFFLLRDGLRYTELVRDAMPLRPKMRDSLMAHFTVVVRATMKGTVVVAVMQGLVGGIIFSFLGIEGALLWGVLMGFLSLLPAVGTGLVWVPVAIYLLATGAIWKGVILILCGMFVIGMIDNILRPVLVGRDTRLPDFVVLIATLSGLQLFGLNGFIVGPVIAALFIAMWNIVKEQRDEARTPLTQAAPKSLTEAEAARAEGETEAHPG
ncbi:AI-2E family transporter [Novosphingobium sp. 1949]|uniref:AI-2E family transporter n=1 Tax=Novosphingobium organovorum TaxID=2930092 RepID=A0ABT0BHJ9_9SPHN|nr:AI-2E family transporter [Novosphingobium organovorum]MCJ2184537.1 AI-2E family transporter [Novosphingobium organovorum]